MVTAERTGESDPQQAALAVNVLDRETLDEAQVNQLGDLAHFSPGLALSSLNAGQATPYIRGIGSNADGAGSDPSVGVFLDEVYLGRSAAWTGDLFGLQRVEVLRGPQTTLYGRNVVGGAINLVTAKAGEQPVQSLEASLGDGGYRKIDFELSGPVGDGLVYGGLSGAMRRRDGYLESRTADLDQLAQDRKGVRAHLTFFPTLDTETDLTLDYARVDESGPSRHANGGFKDRLLTPLDPAAAQDIHTNWDRDAGVTEGDFWGLALRTDHQFAAADLVSITAYRNSDLYVDDAILYDLDILTSSPGFSPYDTTVIHGHNAYREQAHQFSQEFRLSAQPGRFDWLAGVYYLRESVFRQETYDLDVLVDVGHSLDDGIGPSDQDNITRSYALFGQTGYALNDRWRLVAGGRWSQDRKRIHQQGEAGGYFIMEDYDVRVAQRWARFTPKFSLEFQASEELFGYALLSQGYKSGGFQGQAPTTFAAANPFAPELADNLELGLKWRSADRRYTFNATAFHIDYQDLQVLELFSPAEAPSGDVGVIMTLNAANARSRGIELEWAASPAAGWTLSGSYAWLDAVYTDFCVGEELGFRFTNDAERTGNRLRNAPEHSFSLTLKNERRLGRGLLDTRLDWHYQSKNYQDPANRELAAIPAYALANLRMAWRPNERLELAAWVHNLFDEDYLVHGYVMGDTGMVTPGPPRTAGLTMSYDFAR